LVDARDPSKPSDQTFLRTHLEGSEVEIADDDLHVAAGHFGLRHAPLDAPLDLTPM
jgi:hypothetical protein